MNYGAIKRLDIANGEGIRVSLFVSGCRNRCEHCFQPETWNFSYGKEFTSETENELLSFLEPGYVSGLSLLGGEPFEPENQRVIVSFLKRVKERFPNKNIWCYSGYTFEEITGTSHPNCEVTEEILSMLDVLVDGRFEIDKKDISLQFRGSYNQRLINVKRTLAEKSIVLYKV